MTDSPTADIVPRAGRSLADGRRIVYFDDGAERLHTARDRRELTPVRLTSELRFDPIDGEWIIIAAHRQDRLHLPPRDQCPLCPSTKDQFTEVPSNDYDVVVFENRFPSLTTASTSDEHGSDTSGLCEVICFSSDHSASFGSLSVDRLSTIGRALVDRTATLGRIPGVEYVFFFENRGEEIGVTLTHPHGQIYAYPFVPPHVQRAMASARKHTDKHGTCLFCDVVDEELNDGRRVVAISDRFVCFVPRAARWPVEAHIYPRRHIPDMADLATDELTELLVLQSKLVAAFDRVFDAPVPYMTGVFQAPVATDRDLAHLRMATVTPRRSAGKLKYTAGSETLAGAFINDVVPETAAEMLRNAWE